jgi:hypothetical protein
LQPTQGVHAVLRDLRVVLDGDAGEPRWGLRSRGRLHAVDVAEGVGKELDVWEATVDDGGNRRGFRGSGPMWFTHVIPVEVFLIAACFELRRPREERTP